MVVIEVSRRSPGTSEKSGDPIRKLRHRDHVRRVQIRPPQPGRSSSRTADGREQVVSHGDRATVARPGWIKIERLRVRASINTQTRAVWAVLLPPPPKWTACEEGLAMAMTLPQQECFWSWRELTSRPHRSPETTERAQLLMSDHGAPATFFGECRREWRRTAQADDARCRRPEQKRPSPIESNVREIQRQKASVIPMHGAHRRHRASVGGDRGQMSSGEQVRPAESSRAKDGRRPRP